MTIHDAWSAVFSWIAIHDATWPLVWALLLIVWSPRGFALSLLVIIIIRSCAGVP